MNLCTCELLVNVAKDDVISRAETSRLTGLLANVGFTAPAHASLARASNAQSQSMLTLQRTQCDMQVKALVALTTLSEPEIRQKMALNTGLASVFTSLAAMNNIAILGLPAQLLAQRPDVFAARQEVAAASGDVGSAQAAKYPRLGLSGSVGLAASVRMAQPGRLARVQGAAVQPSNSSLALKLAANGNIAVWQEASIGAEASGLRLTQVLVNVGD